MQTPTTFPYANAMVRTNVNESIDAAARLLHHDNQHVLQQAQRNQQQLQLHRPGWQSHPEEWYPSHQEQGQVASHQLSPPVGVNNASIAASETVVDKKALHPTPIGPFGFQVVKEVPLLALHKYHQREEIDSLLSLLISGESFNNENKKRGLEEVTSGEKDLNDVMGLLAEDDVLVEEQQGLILGAQSQLIDADALALDIHLSGDFESNSLVDDNGDDGITSQGGQEAALSSETDDDNNDGDGDGDDDNFSEDDFGDDDELHLQDDSRSSDYGIQQGSETLPPSAKKRKLNNNKEDGPTGSTTKNGRTSNSSIQLRSYQMRLWDTRFKELQDFHEAHGHCVVPHNWKQNFSLAKWVKRQRYQFKLKNQGKRSTMTDGRIKVLNELGFVWDTHSEGWEERFNELRQYRQEHGHCNVPTNYSPNRQLSIWVKCQRRQYKLYTNSKRSYMTEERIEKLESIGFIWNLRW